MLAARGPVEVLSVDFPRYVGAKIGIYNPSGEKTGTVSHLRNRELLFLVTCDSDRRVDVGRLVGAEARPTPLPLPYVD